MPVAHGTPGRDAFARVFWIGGTGGAGKSTVSAALAARHGLRVYHFDDTGAQHAARATRERHPAFTAFIAMSMDERWLLRPPEEMADNALSGWAERFEFVMDDLLAMPSGHSIIAEGIGILPECVGDIPGAASRAAWLVHTPAFLRSDDSGRMGLTSMTALTSDPERALENLLRRNELIAEHIRREAGRRGLRVVDTDERTSPESAVRLIEAGIGLSG